MSASESETVALPRKSALPILDEELAELFGVLAFYPELVIAVSGGVDSTALLHLVARWLRTLGPSSHRPRVVVVTVDHGLRPESAAEARSVAAQAAMLGLPHETLLWVGEKRARGVQDAAREARYSLLSRFAAVHAPAAVVTAHTEDDQAETLLMRLARGSGLDGLAAIPRLRALDADAKVDLVRPLLETPKARLRATLEAAGVSWIDDPGNDSMAFERGRLRGARATFDALGLATDKLAVAARRLHRAREALDAAASAFCAESVAIDAAGSAALDRATFAWLPAEIRVRVLGRLLIAFGGDARPARLSQIEELERRIDDGSPIAYTLGGCLVSAGGRTLRLCREPAARDLPVVDILPGQDLIWDRRFRVTAPRYLDVPENAPSSPFMVRALGMPAYATLRRVLGCRLPSRPAAVLPAIWCGAVLIAVPQELWGAEDGRKKDISEAHGLLHTHLQPFTATFLHCFGLKTAGSARLFSPKEN